MVRENTSSGYQNRRREGLSVNENELKALLAEAVRDADLHPREIPSIDLYLDQITSLADEKRREGSPRFADRALTKTMINNYSKDGLLSPIKGKKYTKEQIVQMLQVIITHGEKQVQNQVIQNQTVKHIIETWMILVGIWNMM